ncbi:MAG: helix-turn-helix transcriptional regulator [Saprospiraceae bacterium]|nr:helix-turn-helix transcriptional regulator [Saprospiraceae bacterium]
MTIHEKIRSIRMLRQFTQEYMADQLGISTKSYGKIENGITRLTMHRLGQIAAVLQLEPEAILAFNEEQSLNNPPQNKMSLPKGDTPVSATTIELYERLLAGKDSLIEKLKAEVEFLRSEVRHLREKN